MSYAHTSGFALQSTGPGTARPSSSKSPPPPQADSSASAAMTMVASAVRVLMAFMVRQRSKKSNTRRDDPMTQQTGAGE